MSDEETIDEHYGALITALEDTASLTTGQPTMMGKTGVADTLVALGEGSPAAEE